jgi:hypothetical protein
MVGRLDKTYNVLHAYLPRGKDADTAEVTWLLGDGLEKNLPQRRRREKVLAPHVVLAGSEFFISSFCKSKTRVLLGASQPLPVILFDATAI